jgi:ferrous iron transport protein B
VTPGSVATDVGAVHTDGSARPKTRQLEIALVGNPNTGKSALFNRLTGGRQRVGNYPGLTIEKKLGVMKLGDQNVTVLDLPGAYSLAALSADERVVLDVLTGHIRGTSRPDLIVCVLEAAGLPRHLFLASQIAEIGLPVVVALNMWDEIESKNVTIDVAELSKRLGVPVVPTIAKRGVGIAELKDAMQRALNSTARMNRPEWPEPVEQATHLVHEAIRPMIHTQAGDAEVRRLLFDLDPLSAAHLGLSDEQWVEPVEAGRRIIREAGYDPAQVESLVRHCWAERITEGVYHVTAVSPRSMSEKIDDLLTHRVFGLIIFVLLMGGVFQSIYTLAKPLMELIKTTFDTLGEHVGSMLTSMPLLKDLMVNGVIGGVGGVLVFLPQILILFVFICLLEDAGYMPRAAFLMDRLFGWCGLSGKSFVPLLSSYACAVPGIMATRTIEDPKARLTTILIAPLMSCSARLPVYVLLIGAFVEPKYGPFVAGATLLGMHFLGLALAIPAAFVMNRLVLRGKRTPFVLEMPPYRVPHVRDVSIRVFGKAKEFVKRAGTIIFALSIIIWALSYFPRPPEVEERVKTEFVADVAKAQKLTAAQAEQVIEKDEKLQKRLEGATDSAYLEQSFIGRAGKAVQPVFGPAGFDWKITVGVLASFPAREVIISTLSILYNVGEGEGDEAHAGLQTAMTDAKRANGSPVFTVPVAVAIMVFFALCSQCMATLTIIARESSWRWAVFVFCYMTTLAWIGAVITYQVGTAISR